MKKIKDKIKEWLQWDTLTPEAKEFDMILICLFLGFLVFIIYIAIDLLL